MNSSCSTVAWDGKELQQQAKCCLPGFIKGGCFTLLSLFNYLLGHLLEMNHGFPSENRVRKIEARIQKCGCGNAGTILCPFAVLAEGSDHKAVINSWCVACS